MSYSVKHIQNEGFLETVLTGSMNYDEMVAETMACIQYAVVRNIKHFLADTREVAFGISENDVLRLLDFYGNVLEQGVARISILYSGDQNPELYKYYESVAYNRGWKLNTFMERDLAIQWLLMN